MKLAEREFTLRDQQRFASVSGDRNPVHIDPVRARRTQAGGPVVHGIHLLLWALDSFAKAHENLPSLQSLSIDFSKFVYLDERVGVVLAPPERAGKRTRIHLSVDGHLRSKLTLDFGDAAESCPAWPSASLQRIPLSQDPSNLTLETMASLSGQLPFVMTPSDAKALFPSATEWLGWRRLAALSASTCLVGMVCPGLHSIYSGLSVRLCNEVGPQDSLSFRVTEADPRFNSVEQEIAGGGLTGTVHSFVRSLPVEQTSVQSLRSVVGPTEFAGSVALVVGGSRGLGELTAKLIAAGGGRVIVTWHTGREDAERVAQEIRSTGGECETLAYDARKPAEEQLTALSSAPTHAYYFATPTIFRPQAEIFNAKRLQEFLTVYVDGFFHLSQSLRSRQPGLSLFYPSTVFVAERPKGMTEYAMAKAAGETLCADMSASQGPAHVTVSRLPKLPTDQTASVTTVETADPLETMLPIVREVQSWPR